MITHNEMLLYMTKGQIMSPRRYMWEGAWVPVSWILEVVLTSVSSVNYAYKPYVAG